MIKARFDVELPAETWIDEISRAFPATTFRLLTGIAVDDGAVELGEIVGGDVDAVEDAITEHPDVVAFERLYADDERALARYRTTDRSLYEFLRGSSLPPEFPVVAEDGWFEFEVTATREQVQAFCSMLEDADWPHEVLAVVGDTDPERLLTERQRALLDAAVRKGYFEVPRECTLENLAADEGIDASTASGVLRRGEARIVKWFLTGSGTDTAGRP